MTYEGAQYYDDTQFDVVQKNQQRQVITQEGYQLIYKHSRFTHHKTTYCSYVSNQFQNNVKLMSYVSSCVTCEQAANKKIMHLKCYGPLRQSGGLLSSQTQDIKVITANW